MPGFVDDAAPRCQGIAAYVCSLDDRGDRAVRSAWVSADRGSIVTVDDRRTARWFDVASERLAGETQAEAVVGASRGGGVALLLRHDGALEAWTPAFEGERVELGLSMDDLGAISRDARYIVERFMGVHEDARLWDRARGAASIALEASAGIERFAFDDATRVLVAHGKHSTVAYDLDALDTRPAQRVYVREADRVLAASSALVVYDAYMMLCVQRIRASRSEDGEIALAALSVAEIPEAVPVHSLVTIARDVERWASSGHPFERVSIFDGGGVELGAIDFASSASTALALSDDGATLAVGTSSGVTHVFALGTGA